MVVHVVIDTETTSRFIKPKAGYQPARVVELAWKVGGGATRSYLIRPTTFVIPADVNEIHDINHRRAMMDGLEGKIVFGLLIDDIKAVGGDVRLVGHNINRYDKPLIEMELENYGFGEGVVNWFRDLSTYDTLLEAREILSGVLTEFNLGAVYSHIAGMPLVDGHRAGPDVDATYLVLEGLLQRRGG